MMVSAVRRVIARCRDSDGKEEIPFINSLLQNYDSEDKVKMCVYVSMRWK